MVEMDLNACQEDSEYNCADGACIPIDNREVKIALQGMQEFSCHMNE